MKWRRIEMLYYSFNVYLRNLVLSLGKFSSTPQVLVTSYVEYFRSSAVLENVPQYDISEVNIKKCITTSYFYLLCEKNVCLLFWGGKPKSTSFTPWGIYDILFLNVIK